MAYFYDDTLNVQYALSEFASLPVSMAGEGGNRKLEGSVVLGFVGVGTTAGPLTLNIGDSTSATRYGTFVADTVVVGQPITGTLTLTEEGYHMGVSNAATTPQVFTIASVGTGAATGLKAIVGYY